MNKVMDDAQGLADETGQALYFGVCPECGRAGTLINVERAHWCVCHTHQIAWYIGSNLYSAWTTEDPAVWRANNYCLATCRLIQFSADATVVDEYSDDSDTTTFDGKLKGYLVMARKTCEQTGQLLHTKRAPRGFRGLTGTIIGSFQWRALGSFISLQTQTSVSIIRR